MKKILVVLLVLAVAAGVFAQEGEWSLNGKAEIGFYSVLDPEGQRGWGANTHMPVWAEVYNHPYNGWDGIHGQLGIGYTRGDAKVGLAFNHGDGDPVDGTLTYNGENFRFAADVNLSALVSTNMYSLDRLWGDYKFINGMITLEVAYKSRDVTEAGIYASDMTGALVRHVLDYSVAAPGYSTKWSYDHAFNEQPFATAQGHGRTYIQYDKNSYIWADVSIENLSFGVFVPNLFGDFGTVQQQTGPGTPNAADGEFVNDSLKKSVFGVKFNMQPVEVAAQFRLDNYGVYFGGKFNAGPITAGLSFAGVLGTNNPTKDMRFGGQVEFNPGAFSAWVSAFYGMSMSNTVTGAKVTQIGIEPGFFYNVIPTHFQFRTDIGFYFTSISTGPTKAEKGTANIGWAVQPQIFWNFLGTGAGSYWGYGTGMIVRYRLLSDPDGMMGKTNALDVTFKWGF
jgi:hypothetical protein